MLRIMGLSVRFGALDALDGVDLEIAGGERVGIIGPNGSGKTTLLDVVSGLVRPARGTIELAGRSIAGWPPEAVARAGVARCFQTPRLFERMSVLANARAGQFAVPRAERDPGEPAALLDRGGLGPHRDRLAAALTPAERRRLELARAVAARPRLLLLDEPCAGLSKPETDAAVDLIDRASRGRTLVLVEHRMPVVARLCSRVIVLERGRIVADGPCDPVRPGPAVVGPYPGRASGD